MKIIKCHSQVQNTQNNFCAFLKSILVLCRSIEIECHKFMKSSTVNKFMKSNPLTFINSQLSFMKFEVKLLCNLKCRPLRVCRFKKDDYLSANFLMNILFTNEHLIYDLFGKLVCSSYYKDLHVNIYMYRISIFALFCLPF